MRKRLSSGLAALIALITIAGIALPAAAQSDSGPSRGGWIFTPILRFAGGWDDNVLVRGEGDPATGAYVGTLNPRADVEFTGRRGQFSASYDGAFLLYRDLNALNTFDQHGSVSARRLMTPRVALFVRNGFAISPTTELVQLSGIPFNRTGSQVDDATGGIEARLSKVTTLRAAYTFQWVAFDPDPAYVSILRGGYSQGGSIALSRRLSERTTLTAAYDLQHATVGGGNEGFNIQNATVGLDRRLSETITISGGAGVSRLAVSQVAPGRTGPSVRASISRKTRTATVDVLYSRTFVPSYGFGGTTQDEELTGHLLLPLARRVVTSASTSWRSNEPLTVGEPPLKSLWIEGTVGYALAPWARLEAFYAGTHQRVARPGGELNRNRFGFQIVTANPMRIR